jgi:hypothetical protein
MSDQLVFFLGIGLDMNAKAGKSPKAHGVKTSGAGKPLKIKG